MSSTEIHLTSISSLKRHAKSIGRELGIAHHEALDEAARRAGFKDLRDAQEQLAKPAVPFEHSAFLTAYWEERTNLLDESTKIGCGRLTLQLPLRMPLGDLVSEVSLENTPYLRGFILDASDHLEARLDCCSEDDAYIALGRAARALLFMAGTGLTGEPSIERELRAPFLSDHCSFWYDPETKEPVTLSEPYSNYISDSDRDRLKWSDLYMAETSWKGIYSPGSAYPLIFSRSEDLIQRLEQQLSAMVESYKGVNPGIDTGSYETQFYSPARRASGIERTLRPMPSPLGVVRNGSLPYGSRTGGEASLWRPAEPMPLAFHMQIGPILYALTYSQEEHPAKKFAYEAWSDLSQWVCHEYLPSEDLNIDTISVYEGPLLLHYDDNQQRLSALSKVIELLDSGYRDCPPKREILRTLGRAEAHLRKQLS
ncbi:hypothetical protein PZT57_26680 [Pseudomonas aeruginosa]|uniref:hypothetical protein n=1 Tax=Pseudomonas aeruginosa TaxID=287 RepID=UPI002B264CF4|nr:hypothetical protein [Pseudomonas aeruginosa]MEA8592236.1 hypothetical protein [Pseudomonas aeruginosa]